MRHAVLIVTPLVIGWFVFPEVVRPRTFVVAGALAMLVTVVPYETLIRECQWTGERRREIEFLLLQGPASAPAWALMSGNSIPVILVGTALVTAAVAARLEWIRRQMGVPLPAPSAGRAMRRFWRAVRRMPRRRHHEME